MAERTSQTSQMSVEEFERIAVAHFAGHGEWADPKGVLLVVEVTSHDSDTDRRDRQEKPVA
ncbi:hypothetical protein [Streptomyces sp. NPDC058964]|uniref:hypothetical protein n=1 Tax=Streptomyces sp. NPDC058964 TaxID=3346681 RepID=UPI0036957467